ncbi:MAG: hypothetical protein RBT75_14350 [Anaerolineae bacterium]|nr:hypothetical protein [Anaerolineae bacterium]
MAAVIVLVFELLVVLGLLLLADRWLHRHLQGLMFLLTNDAEISVWLYALTLFPGVLLHESSHALTARILGVRIGRLSILPRRVGKKIQLGVVPVEETDIFRASLIGAAPLFAGTAIIFAIGHFVFGTPDVVAALSTGEWLAALRSLQQALYAPDVWIWAFLVFTIGNTMLPSRADTHAWPFLGAIIVFISAILIFAGGGATLLNGVRQLLTHAVRWVILLSASTLLVDAPFFLVIFLLEKALERVTGKRIVYG